MHRKRKWTANICIAESGKNTEMLMLGAHRLHDNGDETNNVADRTKDANAYQNNLEAEAESLPVRLVDRD